MRYKYIFLVLISLCSIPFFKIEANMIPIPTYQGMAGDFCCEKKDCMDELVCKCDPIDCELDHKDDEIIVKKGKPGICAFKESEPVCPFGPSGITEIIDNITKWIFYLSLIIVPLLVVYGALLITTASGEPEKINKAKKIILWAIVGLAIIIFSRAILNLIADALGTY